MSFNAVDSRTVPMSRDQQDSGALYCRQRSRLRSPSQQPPLAVPHTGAADDAPQPCCCAWRSAAGALGAPNRLLSPL